MSTERPTFTYTTIIGTTPEKLWAALTESEFHRQYWGGRSVKSEWTVGARIEHIRPDGSLEFWGEILEANFPRRLAYTWITPDAVDQPPARAIFDLAPMGPNVRLTLTHENINPDPQRVALLTMGWTAILSSLKTLMETGKPLSFPDWKG